MLRSILTAWRPVALVALLALAAAPTNVRAAGHGGGGFHGGGYHGGGGFHAGGYHAAGGFHGVGGAHYGGGYRPGYYGSNHNEYRGDHYYGGYLSPWLYGSPAYISGGYGAAPYYNAPDTSTPPEDYGPSDYYAPEAAAPTPAVTAPTPAPDAAPGPATVDVHVPASAQVWFDDALTKQTGDWRRFISPPLAEGKDFHYAARARWTENGRAVEQTRNVTVHAFEVTVVDFTEPAPADTASK